VHSSLVISTRVGNPNSSARETAFQKRKVCGAPSQRNVRLTHMLSAVAMTDCVLLRIQKKTMITAVTRGPNLSISTKSL
jgi:hypothetical protein